MVAAANSIRAKLVGNDRSVLVTRHGIVIGRERGCEIVVRSQSISRRHARVLLTDEGVFVEDLESRNGTLVNRRRIDGREQLQDGDTLKCGDAVFTLSIAASDVVAYQSTRAIYGIALAVLLLAGFVCGRAASALGELSLLEPPAAAPQQAEAAVKPPGPQPKPAKASKGKPRQDQGFSGKESAAFIKLMREMQRAGIPATDHERLRQLARDKTTLNPQETERVLAVLGNFGTRDTLLEEGFQPTGNSGLPDTNQPEEGVAAREASEPSGAEEESDAAAEGLPPLEPRSAQPGYPLNLGALTAMLLVLGGWWWGLAWITRDGRRTGVSFEPWLLAATCVGPLATWLAVTLPDFGWGLLLQSAGCLAPVLLYAGYRDETVPAPARLIARWQRPIFVDAAEPEDDGPQIELLTKQSTEEAGVPARSAAVENSPGFLQARQVVFNALTQGATDIHLEPDAKAMKVRFRVDGVLGKDESLAPDQGRKTINVIKNLSGMNIAERRRPQDGSFQVRYAERLIDVRVACQATAHGEKMSLRLLDLGQGLATLSDLGLPRELQGKFREIFHLPHGMILCCGPTGAGKSTTLHAALAEFDADVMNIITIEDPVEYRLPNVNHIEINTKAGQSFAGTLRSVLRQDPDVLLVGEIRDGETATVACQAANTGHLVLSTVHANDSVAALYRLCDLDVAPYMVADSVVAIVAQRLVRKLCPKCREKYEPGWDVLRKLNVPADRLNQLYRPGPETAGCADCRGSGYRGRIGVFELLVMEASVREAFEREKTPAAVRAAARKSGMLTLQENALRLALRGSTSLDEIKHNVG